MHADFFAPEPLRDLCADCDACFFCLGVTSVGLDEPAYTRLTYELTTGVARAIVTRPQLLIFDGTLHNMLPATREVLLRRLCAKDEPWSVVFISNDPTFSSHVDRRVILA